MPKLMFRRPLLLPVSIVETKAKLERAMLVDLSWLFWPLKTLSAPLMMNDGPRVNSLHL